MPRHRPADLMSRPEEVTEMRQHLAGTSAEIISSTFDRPASEHIRVAEFALEKASAWSSSTGRCHPSRLDHPAGPRYNTEAAGQRQDPHRGLTAGALQKPKWSSRGPQLRVKAAA
jgi:transcription termination factor Rho